MKEVSNYIPQFNEEELKQVKEHRLKYPDARSAVLPVLWMLQEKYGWISIDALRYAGDLLEVPYEHMIGVVTFYTMFNTKPKGRIHLQVCTNVSCMLRGAYDIFRHLSEKFGIKNKETTDDGLITIEEVECLGSCATAPVIQVNNKEYYENLTIEKVDELIELLKKK